MSANDNTLTAEGLLDHYKRVLARTRDRPPAPRVLVKRPSPALASAPVRPSAPPASAPAPAREPLPYVPNLRAARAIVAPVLKRLDMTWEEIVRDDRHRPYVLARREVYHALRQAGWSYPSIGQLCERDHSSILYAVRKWAEHLTKQANATGE